LSSCTIGGFSRRVQLHDDDDDDDDDDDESKRMRGSPISVVTGL
jgi:hypothetical protein